MGPPIDPIVIGFESSANKLGVGIVHAESGDVLANCRHSYIPATGEGFLPGEAAKHHRDWAVSVLFKAIKEALKDEPLGSDWLNRVICLAYTRGPGMAPCLQAAAIAVRALARVWDKPIAPVNHCVAHIEMGRLVTGVDDPVVLYVSGGNTQVICHASGRYRILGETIDVAVGNALDRVARLLALSNDPTPGHNIETLAKSGSRLIALPYAIKGMDVSFSGLISAVRRIVQRGGADPADVCLSVQETLFAMLVETTERALAHLQSKQVLIVGGVGCNQRLQSMMAAMLRERGGELAAIDERYAIDNGAMIAWTGALIAKHSRGALLGDGRGADVTQRFRTDQVRISWRERAGEKSS